MNEDGHKPLMTSGCCDKEGNKYSPYLKTGLIGFGVVGTRGIQDRLHLQMWMLSHRMGEVTQVTGMAGVGNGCPKHDKLKPVGIQELTHSRIRHLTSDDRGVP